MDSGNELQITVDTPVKFPPLRAILPFIVMAALGISGSLLQTYYGYNWLHVFIGGICAIATLMTIPVMTLMPFVLVAFAFRAVRRTLVRAAPWLITPVYIYALLVLRVEGLVYEATLPHFEYLKLAHEGEDAKCIAAATDLGEGKKIGICRKLVLDNRLLAISDLNEDEIVFDSSDQITLPLQQRSPAWRATAAKVKVLDNSAWYKEPAKERDTFFSITALGNHFYYLNLQYWAFDNGE